MLLFVTHIDFGLWLLLCDVAMRRQSSNQEVKDILPPSVELCFSKTVGNAIESSFHPAGRHDQSD